MPDDEISSRHDSMFRASAETGADLEDLKPDFPAGAWGELDEDHTAQSRHDSWGPGQEYYDKNEPEDIKIK